MAQGPGYTQTTVRGEQVFADAVTFQKPNVVGGGAIGSFEPSSADLTLWGVTPTSATNYALYADDTVTVINVPTSGSVRINVGDVNKAIFLATGGPVFPSAVGAPASAAATGVAGQIAFTSGFIYVCVATDTWVRVAVATW